MLPKISWVAKAVLEYLSVLFGLVRSLCVINLFNLPLLRNLINTQLF